MFEKAVRDRLLSDEWLAGQVKNQVWAGGAAPENAKPPYIVFHRISGGWFQDLPFMNPRYQFSCFAKEYAEAREVAERVAEIFRGFTGIMGNTFPVAKTVIEGEQDIYESETKLYHIPVDVVFLYQTHSVSGGVATKIE